MRYVFRNGVLLSGVAHVDFRSFYWVSTLSAHYFVVACVPALQWQNESVFPAALQSLIYISIEENHADGQNDN